MVENKTIKTSALIGTGVITLSVILMLLMNAGDNPVGYCQSTQEFCIAVDGFSSGAKTRCYNETDQDWWKAPYCKEGWLTIDNDIQPESIEKPEPITVTLNQGVYGKSYKVKQGEAPVLIE